jgi:hypothetical protein
VPALAAGTSANLFAIADSDGPHLVADLGAGQGVELFAQSGETNIRVFHGAPSAGTVDIYTDGDAIIPGLEALSATNYVTVPEGDYAFDVFAAGADPTGTPAFSIPSLNYAADASYTAVAYESGLGFSALRLDEPGIAPAAGNIRVRAVHIANGVGQVDIWNITDPSAPSPLIVDFNFGTATDFLEIPAQAYTLGLDVDNDANPDLTFSIPALGEGTVVNLYAIVDADGPFLAGQLGSTVVPIFPDAGPTNIRVFHASTIANGASAPGVDIYTGGTRAVSRFAYLTATDYLSLPEDTYSFDVFTAGADGATRVGGIEVIVERRLRQQGGVAIGGGLSFTAGIDAPAVADDENYRFFGHGLGGQWVKFASRSRRLRRQNGSRSTLLTTLPST